MADPWKRKEVIGGQTLLLGDCREIVGALEFDAVLADPPYGIRHRRGAYASRKWRAHTASRRIAGDSRPFDPTAWIKWPCILWGANHFAGQLPHGRWLMWDKTLGAGAGDFSEFEVAWQSCKGADRIFRHMWMGIQRESEHGAPRLHPRQKPVALMEWCLGFLPNAQTILDPFAGSGSALVACQRLGRHGIGIEIDEDYFNLACRRVEEATRQPDMFVEQKPPRAEQLTFDGGEHG